MYVYVLYELLQYEQVQCKKHGIGGHHPPDPVAGAYGISIRAIRGTVAILAEHCDPL